MARFQRAGELLAFVLKLAGRNAGMTLREVADEFPGDNLRSRQTAARRILGEVEALFPTALHRFTREDGAAAVRLEAVAVAGLPTATTEDVVALAHAAALLRERGGAASAARLDVLADCLRARLRVSGQRLREADVEALLDGRHLLARPGPRDARHLESADDARPFRDVPLAEGG